MAITTIDGLVAGFQPVRAFTKIGIATAAVAAGRAYTPWYVSGVPGAATANTAGVNGAAVTGPVAGMIPRSNPVSGNAHVAQFRAASSIAGTFWLIDRLWNNSGLSVTATTLQSITPAAIPARDVNGTTNGVGVFAAIEWSATGGAGTPTCTLTYTNSAGTTGRTTTLTAVTTPPVGTLEVFPLAAGDEGVRAITGFQMSATRTSGTYHLMLFRVVAQCDVNSAYVSDGSEFLTMGGPQVYDNSVLQLLYWPSANTAASYFGTYSEAHG